MQRSGKWLLDLLLGLLNATSTQLPRPPLQIAHENHTHTEARFQSWRRDCRSSPTECVLELIEIVVGWKLHPTSITQGPRPLIPHELRIEYWMSKFDANVPDLLLGSVTGEME
jgi:hypothetical protein